MSETFIDGLERNNNFLEIREEPIAHPPLPQLGAIRTAQALNEVVQRHMYREAARQAAELARTRIEDPQPLTLEQELLQGFRNRGLTEAAAQRALEMVQNTGPNAILNLREIIRIASDPQL